MQDNKNVCRFCLKLVPAANIESFDEVTKKILEMLLINLDFNVSEDPLMCNKCSNNLDEIYMFKSKCLYSEDIISAHFEINSLKVSLCDILNEIENKPANTARNKLVCRLCLKIPHGNYVNLQPTGKKEMDLSAYFFCTYMIQKQLPEIDLSMSEGPIICEACHVQLKNYLSFITNCMDVEKKIKLYSNLQGSNNKGRVDLGIVLDFIENKDIYCKSVLDEYLVIKQAEGYETIEIMDDEDDGVSDSSSTQGDNGDNN